MTARFVTAALVAATLASAASASAAAPGPGTGSVPCIGLICDGSGLPASSKAQARWTASSLSSPLALKEQKAAGYYEFGQGTTVGGTAVAYVIPPGRLADAPAEIRGLRVVKDIDPPDYATGTVVVFDAGAALWAPTATLATAAREKRRGRPRARAAADQYGCADSYFCIYNGRNFTNVRLQWHDINHGSNWVNLTDWGFNDQAKSDRNRRDRDSWLAEHVDGGGDRHCYDSHSSDADFEGWNDDASSLFNSAGDAGC